ncbi:MAG TPA: molybdopterin molybdotransferase MoeA [Candidatus Baltobacteraceae bacterium]|nr:molybdopterin molybdotransferase MoeA [Candidatus Baltobacteraceae bacterium]
MAERLLAPRQAMVAFFARVELAGPQTERTPLAHALGRILAEEVCADEDYPRAPRSVMDGFAIVSADVPGELPIVGDVRMGEGAGSALPRGSAMRIPTGGTLPPGADAVVPIEDVRLDGDAIVVEAPVAAGSNVIETGADMRRGETVLSPGRRLHAPEIGVLATLGVTNVPVYRRPVVAVLSSGDELVAPHRRPVGGQIRDSNRYAVAASLELMGAQPRHYPTLRDEADEFEAALDRAIDECDAVVVTGGSSVGERDRLPHAVEAIARPGVVVHGLRLKPGKPTLLGAHGAKPIVGLPGNPTSALMVLEAVAAPLFAALIGAPVRPATVNAHLAQPALSRVGWTWYIPVAVHEDGGRLVAEPLAVRSFSVSLTARAGGYLVMGEAEEEWPAATVVTVHRFLGGS